MHRINRCRKLRKYILPILLISILPGICFGASARYTQLVREKQRKIEQLEKCMGTNKGLQIAGISTLGLTAVGVAGNIAEAKIIKKNEKTLEKQNTTLAEKQAEYNKKHQEYQLKKATVEATTKTPSENIVTHRNLVTVVEEDIQRIAAQDVKIGAQAITHGYRPGQLPTDLKNKLAASLAGFSQKCKSLENNNGVASVEVWENSSAQDTTGAYEDETKTLQNIDAFVVMECKLNKCIEETHAKRGDKCVKKSSDCTEEAKKKDTNVVLATKNGDKCEIQQCSDGFEVSDDKSKCEEKNQLSDEEKANCLIKIMRDFPIEGTIPERFQSKYNEYLSGLKNRVSDIDGFIQYEVNGIYSECKNGQTFSQCTNANIILPAIARRYTKEYAENMECDASNNLNYTINVKAQRISFGENTTIKQQKKQICIDGGATGYDVLTNRCVCPDNKVWAPSARQCQDPETAARNADFDKNLKRCQQGGAMGYSVTKGCLCENETKQEWDGSKCVGIDKTAQKRCSDSGGKWENAKCECPSGQLEVSGKCFDGHNENKVKCIGLGGDWVDGSCENLVNSNLSDEDACFFEGGDFIDGICICSDRGDSFDPISKTCKRADLLRPESVGLNVVPVSIQNVNIKITEGPEQIGCRSANGTWDTINHTCICPQNASFWDNINKTCKNPVAVQYGFSGILAQ